MELQEEKISVVNEATGKEREMTKTQLGLIGTDPGANGGWKVAEPSEAAKIPDPELQAARARFEELHPGERAGNKGLKTLQEAIAKASHPNE